MPSFGPISAGGNATADAINRTYPCTGRASRMMNSRISTKRKTQPQGSNGFPAAVWAEHIAGVCATIQIQSTFEAGGNMRETGETNATLYCPPGVDIITADRIYPLTGAYVGKAFEVDSPIADDAGFEAYSRFTLKRVEGGGTR